MRYCLFCGQKFEAWEDTDDHRCEATVRHVRCVWPGCDWWMDATAMYLSTAVELKRAHDNTHPGRRFEARRPTIRELLEGLKR